MSSLAVVTAKWSDSLALVRNVWLSLLEDITAIMQQQVNIQRKFKSLPSLNSHGTSDLVFAVLIARALWAAMTQGLYSSVHRWSSLWDRRGFMVWRRKPVVCFYWNATDPETEFFLFASYRNHVIDAFPCLFSTAVRGVSVWVNYEQLKFWFLRVYVRWGLVYQENFRSKGENQKR